MSEAGGPAIATGRLAWTLGWTAAAVLGFEVALLRVLLVASWHHFAFAVISVVLLGFGASGTLLHLLRARLLRDAERSLLVLALLTAVTMPLAILAAGRVPLEARLAPAVALRQLAAWGLYWAILTVPFVLGAMTIGLGLIGAGARRMGTVYAANLGGSAVGALMAPALMTLLPPALLASSMGALACLGGMAQARRRWPAAVLGAVLVGVFIAAAPADVRPDPYKRSAAMARLVAQGSVTRVARARGPRAQIEAYQGAVLHDLPFLSTTVTPPPVTVLLADGHTAGSVLEIQDRTGAAVMDGALVGVAYELVGPGASVALLGETGGHNVWLALRAGAERIEVVQPDAVLVRVVRRDLAALGGAVLDHDGVTVTVAEPRHVLQRDGPPYDLVHLVSLEGSAAGTSGIGGLAQDHLVTVEGIDAALGRLATDGLLVVARGIQDPPRDNLKLLATFVEALRRRGATDPAGHLVVVRDFLAVCTLLRPRPWTPMEIESVRAQIKARHLTPVWFTGITEAELNRPDALPAPPDGVGDWYHFGIRQLLGPSALAFIDGWAFDIRPPTDGRPFFADFCRLRSLGALREAYGETWLMRLEVAYLVVLVTVLAVGVVGAAATVLPLPLVARRGEGPWWSLVAYFGALGLGYLALEMVVLARVRWLLGDPVLAAALTIGGFLLFSGLGSLTVGRRGWRLRWVLGAVALGAVVVPLVLGWLAALAGDLAPLVLGGLVVLAVGPVAFLMGIPMPAGLGSVDEHAPALLPWAWAANGFASVLAAPLTVALAMAWSYHAAAWLAAGAYGAALVVAGGLRRGPIAASALQGA